MLLAITLATVRSADAPLMRRSSLLLDLQALGFCGVFDDARLCQPRMDTDCLLRRELEALALTSRGDSFGRLLCI